MNTEPKKRGRPSKSSPQTTTEETALRMLLESLQKEAAYLKTESVKLRNQQYDMDKLEDKVEALEMRLIEKTQTIVEQKAVIKYLEGKMFRLIKGGGNG